MTFLEVTYPMRAYWDADDKVNIAIRQALRPFGVGYPDGAGSDGVTRDVSYTLPEGVDADLVAAAVREAVAPFGGGARALSEPGPGE